MMLDSLKTSNCFNDRPFIKFCCLVAASGGCHASKKPRCFANRGTTWTTATGPSTGKSAVPRGVAPPQVIGYVPNQLLQPMSSIGKVQQLC